MKQLTFALSLLILFPIYVFGQKSHISLSKVKKGEKHGYVDGEANLVIPVEYDLLGEFNDGLVTGHKNNEWFVLDIKGNIVLELGTRYKYVGQFGSGLCFATNNAEYESYFNEKPSLRINDDDIRFINVKGKEVFKLHDSIPRWVEYFDDFRFNNGFLMLPTISAKTSPRTVYGYVNTKGKLVVPQIFHTQYEGVYGEFHNGLAFTANQKSSKFIDKENPDRYGFIDTTGKWVIPPELSYGERFENGIAYVLGCWFDEVQYCSSRLIDINGESIFGKDTWVDDFRDGNGYVSVGKEIRGKSKYALAKTDGTYITGFVYNKITAPFENGHFIAKKGRKSGILTKEGKWLQPIKKSNYGRYDYLIGLVSDKDDYRIMGFIDMDGNIVLPLKKRDYTKLEGGIIKERISGPSSEDNEVFAYYSRKGQPLDLSEYDEIGKFQWILVE